MHYHNPMPSKENAPAGCYVPCPRCQSTNVSLVGFTWWGGVIGSKILTHCKCGDCGATFNGKTGKSNTAGIIIYTLVVAVIIGAIVMAIDS
jgi:transposase-like protein